MKNAKLQKASASQAIPKPAGNQPALKSEIQGNTWSVSLPNTELCTADALIKYCKADMSAEIDALIASLAALPFPAYEGHEPCDVEIMEAMFNRALDALIARSTGYQWERILFTVGNDLLNFDNIESTTTKGTAVTSDGRYHHAYLTARTMIIRAIEKLCRIAPVTVLVVPGNHDRLACFHLGDSLECYFHSDSNVEVLNDPCPRKYVEFGKVMLMFCHGDEGKRNDYALLIATERPGMFGRTRYREVHIGHTHQTRLDEQHGVRVRIIPSLSPPDDWHSTNGFVGNLRSAEAYFWNKDQGLVGTAIYNDDAQPPLITKRTFANPEGCSSQQHPTQYLQ